MTFEVKGNQFYKNGEAVMVDSEVEENFVEENEDDFDFGEDNEVYDFGDLADEFSDDYSDEE